MDGLPAIPTEEGVVDCRDPFIFLAMPAEIRKLIYQEIFGDLEVWAASRESVSSLVLHPQRLCYTTPYYPRKFPLAITKVSKQIRNESLGVLWSKLVRVSTNLAPRSLLTTPSCRLCRVRILDLDFEGCRRSTNLRPDDMKSLLIVIMNPYVGSAKCANTEADKETVISEEWRRFAREFIRRKSRKMRNSAVDHFLANTLPVEGLLESPLHPLHSTYKVLFRRTVSIFIPRSRNIQSEVRSETLHYDIGAHQRVELDNIIQESLDPKV